MLKIGRALGTQIDDDVENRAASGSHQLAFGGWRELEMHSPHCPLLDIESDVGLRDGGVQPMCFEFFLTKGAGKIAARILPAFEIENESTLEFSLGKDHLFLFRF